MRGDSVERAADSTPYTELAKSLLQVIEERGATAREKTQLREDLLRNVLRDSVGWTRLILDENPELASLRLYQRPTAIRELLVPETSAFTLGRLRGQALTKAVGRRIVRTVRRLRG